MSSTFSGSQLPTAWKAEFRPLFEELIIPHVFNVYHQAHEYCIQQGFSLSERRNCRPQLRYTLLEQQLRLVGEELGLAVEAFPNKRASHWHRQLQSGVFVVTQSHLQKRFEMPNFADFRETLARDSQQTLFGEISPSPDAQLFAILTHREQDGKPWLPAFFDVMFPVSATQHAGIFVKLFDDYPNIVEAHTGFKASTFDVEVEEIEAPAAPKLLNPDTQTGTDSQ